MTIPLLALATNMLPAAYGASSPHLFGSYVVVQSTGEGRETKLELRLRLANPSSVAVSIEKVTLLSLAPAANNSLAAPISISAHGVQEIVQRPTISTAEYQSWQRGLRPSLRVEMRMEDGVRVSQTLRLNSVPLREGK
jgi:hypothetical protein